MLLNAHKTTFIQKLQKTMNFLVKRSLFISPKKTRYYERVSYLLLSYRFNSNKSALK